MLWLRRFLRVRQRNIDKDVLWPACKDKAPDLGHARLIFILHATQDPAWTEDFTDDQITDIVREWE